MFDNQSQPKVEALIQSNPEFKQLYQRHQYLDKKLMDSDLSVNAIDDVTAHGLKKEKLAAKQRLTALFEQVT